MKKKHKLLTSLISLVLCCSLVSVQASALYITDFEEPDPGTIAGETYNFYGTSEDTPISIPAANRLYSPGDILYEGYANYYGVSIKQGDKEPKS